MKKTINEMVKENEMLLKTLHQEELFKWSKKNGYSLKKFKVALLTIEINYDEVKRRITIIPSENNKSKI